MSPEPLLSHEQIIKEIGRLHAERKTGLARIATVDNQLFQVAFDNGDIIEVVAGLKRGQDAIKLFNASTASGRVKFAEGKVRQAGDSGLVSTAGTLRMFGLTQTLASAPAGASNDGPTIDVSVIEREAVEFLGPMASIIWEEQLKKVGSLERPGAVQRLVDALTKEIGSVGDAGKAKLFKTTVERKLAGKS
ncbi:MAG: hypothetical protein ACJ8J7_03420 [Sulfurifustaceae bacterium]